MSELTDMVTNKELPQATEHTAEAYMYYLKLGSYNLETRDRTIHINQVRAKSTGTPSSTFFEKKTATTTTPQPPFTY